MDKKSGSSRHHRTNYSEHEDNLIHSVARIGDGDDNDDDDDDRRARHYRCTEKDLSLYLSML